MADATSFLLGLLTPGQVLLALGVLVVTLLVFDFVSTPKYPRLPTVGHQGGILSSLRNIVDYPSCFREWLLEGFVKVSAYKNEISALKHRIVVRRLIRLVVENSTTERGKLLRPRASSASHPISCCPSPRPCGC